MRFDGTEFAPAQSFFLAVKNGEYWNLTLHLIRTRLMMKPSLLAAAIAIASFMPSLPAAARPAEIFSTHLDDIRQNLPPGHVMRLPSRMRLSGPVAFTPDDLIVKVIAVERPATLTVGLFTCETGAYPCLVGSFSAMNANVPTAQQELARHQATAMAVTLAPGVQGFLREGTAMNPRSDFSSVMWEQDGMIYTVSFLNNERPNILAMAASMARDLPIRRTNQW